MATDLDSLHDSVREAQKVMDKSQAPKDTDVKRCAHLAQRLATSKVALQLGELLMRFLCPAIVKSWLACCICSQDIDKHSCNAQPLLRIVKMRDGLLCVMQLAQMSCAAHAILHAVLHLTSGLDALASCEPETIWANDSLTNRPFLVMTCVEE